GHQRPLDAELAQQARGVPRVLRGDDVGIRQHFARTGRHIGGIADRRRDQFDSAPGHPRILRMGQRPHVTSTLFAAALLALLAACQTTPTGPGPASEARAERLVRQGNHADAARMYEDLAAANPAPDRDQFAMAATRAWLDANRPDD